MHCDKHKVKEWIQRNSFIVWGMLVYVSLICVSLYRQGVTCNDEAQYKLYAGMGFKAFFQHYLHTQIFDKGRFLSALPTTISLYIGSAITNDCYIRGMAIIIMLICVIVFALLLYKIFEDSMISLLFIIIIWGNMPIAFEHCAPNAFVALFGIPFLTLEISLLIYISYLKTGMIKKCIISSILFLFPLCSYEIFITYTPLYLLLAFYFSKERVLIARLKEAIIKFIGPLSSAVVFLLAYIVTGRVFPSQYDGTQISFTIDGALKIIVQLTKSSMPGYYLTNGKYRFLYQWYCNNKASSFGKSIFLNINIRIGIIFILSFTLFFFCWHKMKVKDKCNKKDYLIVISGMLFVVLPMLPLSISSMYQGKVTSDFFSELPVCYFSNYATVFCITYLIFVIKKSKFQKILIWPILSILLFIILCVQTMNDTFSIEQEKNSKRMVAIENVLSTDTLHELDGETIYCEDIYEIRNLLAFNPGYWETYAQNVGTNVLFSNDENTCSWRLYFEEDEYFLLENNQECYIMIPNNNNRTYGMIKFKDNYKKVDLGQSQETIDNGFRVYKYSKK